MHLRHALFVALAGCLVGPAAGADPWLALPGMDFAHRLAVTVENPADVDADSALIRIPLDQLATPLPDARPGHLAVVDPGVKPAKRDRADENFLPFQIEDGALVFALPLKPGERRQLFIYTSPGRVNLPGFPAKTAVDQRHAYRSFENNLMAFRMETGPGANTTGMAIDLFGKTAKGQGLRLPELYDSAHASYHELQYWGIDCLKIGSSPGLGGVYLVVGEQTGRPDALTTFFDVVHRGPVQTTVRATAPVEVAGRRFTVVRTLTVWAGERGIADRVEVRGDDLSAVQVGVGLRNLPNEQWIERPGDGYAFNHGDNNQPNYRSVGLGIAFHPTSFERIIHLPDPTDGGRIYVFNPQRRGDVLESQHHLAAIWDGDGQIRTPAQFENYLQRQAKLMANPPRVTLAASAEPQP